MEFSDGTNILIGENGQGKTNVLEALSYLCLTKSFYAGSDSLAVQRGHSLFEVRGLLRSDRGDDQSVRVSFDAATNVKTYEIGGNDISPRSSAIGLFPLTVLSPEQSAITFGTPADRRRFVDMVISQSSKVYIEDIMEYRRILRQRNRILTDTSRRGGRLKDCEDAIAPWTETLVDHGSRITVRRAQFLKEFTAYIVAAYRQLAAEEDPSISYCPHIAAEDAGMLERVEEQYRSQIAKCADDEVRLGVTLIGPHKDEVILSLDGLGLRDYASQGQHKTFLIALKIAEFSYLKDRAKETPVFLLDDVFSELDENRTQRLLFVLEMLGQTFITATSNGLVDQIRRTSRHCFLFTIHNGALSGSRAEVGM